MNYCFFGHRDANDSLQSEIGRILIDITADNCPHCFFVGNNGNFDCMVQKELHKVASVNTYITVYFVLSRPDERVISGYNQYSIYPEGLEGTPKRFLISKRNNWIIKRCNAAIVCLNHRFTNTSGIVELAKKKGLEIINICKLADY